MVHLWPPLPFLQLRGIIYAGSAPETHAGSGALCPLTVRSRCWVYALPQAGCWRGLLTVPSCPRCLTGCWQGRSPSLASQALRTCRGTGEAHAADCRSCRHRRPGRERHGGVNGVWDQTCTPHREGPDSWEGMWGQRELLGRGAGVWGDLCLQGSCGLEQPSLCLPQHTGAIFLLGQCHPAPAIIQHLLLEGGFFAQPIGCMKPAWVRLNELGLVLIHYLVPLARLCSRLNLHKTEVAPLESEV